MRILGPSLWTALLLCAAATPLLAQGEGRKVGRQCDQPHAPVLSASFTGVTEEQFRTIENEADWCAFWEEVHSILFPRPPCDTTLIDFDWEVAIVATLGPRPNACYDVKIACLQALGESHNIRATVVETEPGPACGCLQAIVHPVDVVKVDRPVKQVQLRKKTAILDCR